MSELPNTVRYIKNGKKGCWWEEASSKSQSHAGWSEVSGELLVHPIFSEIRAVLEESRQRRGLSGRDTQDLNALWTLLDRPSQHVWITYEDGCMWWCTVKDGAHPNPTGESQTQGHFWLICDRRWSKHSLGGRLLGISDLPGDVTLTKGFRRTVGTPRHQEKILRVLRDEPSRPAASLVISRTGYTKALRKIISSLSWKDFELLVNLILERSGWSRLSRLGGSEKSIDLDVANWAIEERAFVQVKAAAGQKELDNSVADFKRCPQYTRMIFAVHSPRGTLKIPSGMTIHVWQDEQIADLVVRVGLGDWVEKRLA